MVSVVVSSNSCISIVLWSESYLMHVRMYVECMLWSFTISEITDLSSWEDIEIIFDFWKAVFKSWDKSYFNLILLFLALQQTAVWSADNYAFKSCNFIENVLRNRSLTCSFSWEKEFTTEDYIAYFLAQSGIDIPGTRSELRSIYVFIKYNRVKKTTRRRLVLWLMMIEWMDSNGDNGNGDDYMILCTLRTMVKIEAGFKLPNWSLSDRTPPC